MLADRVVVVTGAARGQGAAQVRLLAEHGATVVATDVLDDDGQELATELRDRGLHVEYRHLDVADPTAWSALATELGQGPAAGHGLVNNAGTTWRARVGALDIADWDRVQAINTTGPLLGMQALLPLMGSGRRSSTSVRSPVSPATTPLPTPPASGPCGGCRRVRASSSARAASAST